MKNHVPVALVLCLASPADAKMPRNDASCIMDSDAYCTEEFVQVEMTKAAPAVTVRLNVALGDAVSVRVPPGLRVAKDDLKIGNAELFQVGLGSDGVTIRPRIDEKSKPRLMELAKERDTTPEEVLLGETGNVQISSKPWFLSINLQIAPKAKSVQFLRVTSRDLAQEESRIEADCASRLETEWKKVKDEQAKLAEQKLEHDGDAVAFQSMFEGQCRSSWWTAMQDLLWVEVHRICEIGDRLMVSFTIRNEDGGGRIFRHGRIELLNGDGKASPIKPARVVWAQSLKSRRRIDPESISLSEDQSVVGAIHVARDRATDGRLTLQIVERGETRKVLVGGIGF
jgi:hypothetical protein